MRKTTDREKKIFSYQKMFICSIIDSFLHVSLEFITVIIVDLQKDMAEWNTCKFLMNRAGELQFTAFEIQVSKSDDGFNPILVGSDLPTKLSTNGPIGKICLIIFARTTLWGHQ